MAAADPLLDEPGRSLLFLRFVSSRWAALVWLLSGVGVGAEAIVVVEVTALLEVIAVVEVTALLEVIAVVEVGRCCCRADPASARFRRSYASWGSYYFFCPKVFFSSPSPGRLGPRQFSPPSVAIHR